VTGVVVDDEVVATFEDFKLQRGDFKGVSYILYKIDSGKIVIDKIGAPGASYDDYLGSLPETDPRYSVVDVKLTTNDGRETSKLVFISWIPDAAKIKSKMLYSGSKESLKAGLAGGVGIHVNATDLAEVDYEDAIKPVCMRFA
jgi:cofilin